MTANPLNNRQSIERALAELTELPLPELQTLNQLVARTRQIERTRKLLFIIGIASSIASAIIDPFSVFVTVLVTLSPWLRWVVFSATITQFIELLVLLKGAWPFVLPRPDAPLETMVQLIPNQITAIGNLASLSMLHYLSFLANPKFIRKTMAMYWQRPARNCGILAALMLTIWLPVRICSAIILLLARAYLLIQLFLWGSNDTYTYTWVTNVYLGWYTFVFVTKVAGMAYTSRLRSDRIWLRGWLFARNKAHLLGNVKSIHCVLAVHELQARRTQSTNLLSTSMNFWCSDGFSERADPNW